MSHDGCDASDLYVGSGVGWEVGVVCYDSYSSTPRPLALHSVPAAPPPPSTAKPGVTPLGALAQLCVLARCVNSWLKSVTRGSLFFPHVADPR